MLSKAIYGQQKKYTQEIPGAIFLKKINTKIDMNGLYSANYFESDILAIKRVQSG